MRAKKLFTSTADLSNAKVFVAALILLQAKAKAAYTIVCGVEIIWTHAIPTAATDGVYIYINPDFFTGLRNNSQRAFLLFHEVAHIILRHPQRGKFYHDRGFFAVTRGEKVEFNNSIYNRAADYVINADGIKHGLEFIPSGCLDDRFSRDDIVDTVYAQLIQEPPEPDDDGEDGDGEDGDDDGDGEGGDGSRTEPSKSKRKKSKSGGDSGDGDDDDDTDGDDADGDQDGDDQSGGGDDGDDQGDDQSGGGSGQGDDQGDDQDGDSGEDSGEESGDGDNKSTSQEPSNHGGHDDHYFPEYEDGEEGEEAAAKDADDMDKIIERAVKDMRDDPEADSKNIGKGGIFGQASTYGGGNCETNVPWNEIFANRFTRAGSGGRLNWGRIHRRRFSTLGIVSPTRKGTFNQVAVTIDISGSVDHSVCHNKVFPELGVMIDHLKPTSGCIILLTDTKVQHVVTVHSSAELLDVQIPCGGGTYMHSGAKWLEENGHMPDVHICFTDGHMCYGDYENCANSDMFLVIDNEFNYNYNLSNIRQSNIEAICADDNWVAA